MKDETGAEDGIQIELADANYTLFFPDLGEARFLDFQLKQLKDYLGLEGYAYL